MVATSMTCRVCNASIFGILKPFFPLYLKLRYHIFHGNLGTLQISLEGMSLQLIIVAQSYPLGDWKAPYIDMHWSILSEKHKNEINWTFSFRELFHYWNYLITSAFKKVKVLTHHRSLLSDHHHHCQLYKNHLNPFHLHDQIDTRHLHWDMVWMWQNQSREHCIAISFTLTAVWMAGIKIKWQYM